MLFKNYGVFSVYIFIKIGTYPKSFGHKPLSQVVA